MGLDERPEVHSTTTSGIWCARHRTGSIPTITFITNTPTCSGWTTTWATRFCASPATKPWAPRRLFQPISNLVLASTFEWGIGLHDIGLREIIDGEKPKDVGIPQLKLFGRKIIRQVGKDYVLYPALTGPNFFHTLTANATANLIRNLWAYVVIFCGHFPDGAEKFTIDTLEHETQGQWYLRQMLGSANFHAGPVMAFMSGNLCYQIEHHLFPDLPSNRLAGSRCGFSNCARSTTCPTPPDHCRCSTSRRCTINKLALPDQMLHDTADAPETASERRFAALPKPQGLRISGGLKTAIAQSREQRRQRKGPEVAALPRVGRLARWDPRPWQPSVMRCWSASPGPR